MGKHAFLIIAHNDWSLLSKLLMCLDDKRNSIFVHIDKNSDFRYDNMYVPSEAECTYIERRKVMWGGESLIIVEMELIRAAVKSNQFDFLHLISGQDLPLKTQDEIHNWFDNFQGRNFISLDPDSNNQHTAIDRISRYWIFQDIVGRRKGIGFVLLRRLDRVLLKIQKMFKVDRTKKIPMKIYKGANWFSITSDMAEEILSNQKQIMTWFGMGWCADELFLHTIAYNSSQRETIINDSLREIDWERGQPYTYTKEDKELLLKSEKLFARKFSTTLDSEIIDIVYNRAKGV